jgi:hypothetical protein
MISVRAVACIALSLLSTACPATTCITSLRIEFTPPLSKTGHYVVRISAPQMDEAVCKFDLPLPRDTTQQPDCTDNLFLTRRTKDPIGSWGEAHLLAAPTNPVFEIEIDDVVVVSRELSPEYQVHERGGMECFQATTVVEWQ